MRLASLAGRSEAACALAAFALAAAVAYPEVALLGRSLLAPLYMPAWTLPVATAGPRPAPAFNVDLATSAFYEAPINVLVGRELAAGRVPLWNPYQGAGAPLAAQYSTRAFFPYQMIQDLCPPPVWDFFSLGRLVLAALFTFLALRDAGLSRAASFAGGAAYGFSGSMIWFVALEQMSNVGMVAPLALLASGMLARQASWRAAVWLAGALALVLVAGQPEVALYVLLLAMWYLAASLWPGRGDRRRVVRVVGLWITAVALALGLAAPLIVPFLELVPESYNVHPTGGEAGIGINIYPFSFAAVVLPVLTEAFAGPRVLPVPETWDFLGGYTGVTTLFLCAVALLAPALARAPAANDVGTGAAPGVAALGAAMAAFGVLVTVKNAGIPPATWLGRLPLFDQVWSPRWAGPAWCLALAMAAAAGMDRLPELSVRDHRRIARLFLAALVPILALAPLVGSTAGTAAASAQLVRAAIVVAAVAAGLALSLSRPPGSGSGPEGPAGGLRPPSGAVAAAWIVELVVLIPRGTGPEWVERRALAHAAAGAGLLLVAAGRRRVGGAVIAAAWLGLAAIGVRSDRGMPLRQDPFRWPAGVPRELAPVPGFRVTGVNGALMPNLASALAIPDIHFIHALSPARVQQFAGHHLVREKDRPPSDALWVTGIPDRASVPGRERAADGLAQVARSRRAYALCSVRTIVSRRALEQSRGAVAAAADAYPGLRLVRDGELRVWENAEAVPRAYVVGRVHGVAGEDAAFARALSPGFDPRAEAVVTGGAVPPPGGAVPASPRSTAAITVDTPTRVTVRAHLDGPGLLVLTDTHYPGWIATIVSARSERPSGTGAPVLLVNGMFRGVWLPAGDHEVHFIYRPASVRLGLALALLALAACLRMAARRPPA
jgi:hypothetical protein